MWIDGGGFSVIYFLQSGEDLECHIPRRGDIYGIREGKATRWLKLHVDSTIGASYSL